MTERAPSDLDGGLTSGPGGSGQGGSGQGGSGQGGSGQGGSGQGGSGQGGSGHGGSGHGGSGQGRSSGGAPVVASRAGLAQAVAEQFSIQASIGGTRGLIESVLPLTIFSVVFGVTHQVRVSVISAVVPAVVLAAWRLIARESVIQAVSGVAGLAIGAVLALRTGRPEALFLPSILKNAAYAGAYAVSILIRWPVVGVILGFMLGEQLHWRTVPRRARVYAWATWIWVGVFALRLAVQIPLYLSHRAEALGFVNIPLGLPLFGLAVWLTWVLVRRVPVAHPEHDKGSAVPASD